MELSEYQTYQSIHLPKQYHPATLIGKKVRLEPYDSLRDSAILFNRTHGKSFSIGQKSTPDYDCNELVWKYLPYGPFASIEEFDGSIQERLTKNYRFFTVFDIESDSQIGFIAKLSNFPEHLKVEI